MAPDTFAVTEEGNVVQDSICVDKLWLLVMFVMEKKSDLEAEELDDKMIIVCTLRLVVLIVCGCELYVMPQCHNITGHFVGELGVDERQNTHHDLKMHK